MIKVFLVDDHILVRQGIKKILELEEDLTVIGEAGNGEEALEELQGLQPDIVLLDIHMPVLDGIETLRKMKPGEEDPKVIMLTFHKEKEYVLEAINLGAKGYMLKDAGSESLIQGIRDVYKGGSYIQPTLASELVKSQNEPKPKPSKEMEDLKKLTRREREVLKLISEGMNNREIADTLFISEKTVKNHVSNIFKKIHVNDRTQAAIFALKNQRINN